MTSWKRRLLALALVLTLILGAPAPGTFASQTSEKTDQQDINAFEIARKDFFNQTGDTDAQGQLETIVIPDEPHIIEKPFVPSIPGKIPNHEIIESPPLADDFVNKVAGPFSIGDERLFYASISDGYSKVPGRLVGQGKYSNVWILDDAAYHLARGNSCDSSCLFADVTPAKARNIANVIDGIVERMTDPSTGFGAHANQKITAWSSSGYNVGDIDNDGMVNFVLYPLGYMGIAGYYWSMDSWSAPNYSNLDVLHIDINGIMGTNPLYYYGTLAHEFQHMLFDMYYGSHYSGSGDLSWINESLADLAKIYYLQPGAESLVSGRAGQAALNPYSTGSYGDFVNFQSLKSYGTGYLFSLFMFKKAPGHYTSDLYTYFKTQFPPATTSAAYNSNAAKTSGKSMDENIGNAFQALGIGSGGKESFAQTYWMFMESFAADGGTVRALNPALDTPTMRFFAGSNAQTENMWSQRGNFAGYPLANGGAVELGGYGTGSPRIDATHEKIYKLTTEPTNSTDTVLNFTINDPTAGSNTRYYVALKRPGSAGQFPNADIYPLTPGVERSIKTNGKEAYLYATTLYRQVNSTAAYSWTAPSANEISGTITLDTYIPRANTAVTATVNTTLGGPYTYVWTSDGVVVANGTSNTYTATEADIGKIIKVSVTSNQYSSGSLETQTLAVARLAGPSRPTPPVALSRTTTSVTLVEDPSPVYQYSLDNTLWWDSPVFTNLLPDTDYNFYRRVKATSTQEASTASNAVLIRTLAESASSYSIALDKSGTETFASAAYGYAAVTPLTVTVTNTGDQATGNLNVTIGGTNATSYAISNNNAASGIAPDGSATFQVGPNAGLAAGTHTATVTVGGTNVSDQTFSLSFTVTKANPVVTWPTNLTATYGQTLADVSLPGNGSGTPAGTFSWTAGNAVSVGSVGTQTHNLTFTPTDTANYNAVSGDVQVVVNPATVAPAITSANETTLNYGTGGTFQVAATGTTPITYSLSGVPAGISINSASGLISVATAVSAGTYTFTITAANGTLPNATQSFSLTITKAAPVVTWPTNLTATYGQTLADVSLPGNGSGTPAGTFSWTAGNAVSVGSVGTQTHNLTFTPTDTANYSAVSGDVSVVVNPAPIPSAAITVNAPAVGAGPNISATGTGNFTVGPVGWTPAENPFKGSTQYTARVSLTANANYTFAGLAVATINGQGATIISNSGSTVTLSYQFPATGAATLTGMQVASQPAKRNYLVGETLNLAGLSVQLLYNDGTDEVVAYANFASKGITTNPAHGTAMALSHTGTTVAVSFGSFTRNTDALSVSLAPGAAVSAPTMAGKTGNSVTLNNVAAPANGQAVEYAYSTTSTAPASGWQDGLVFNGLTEYTEYYFFARTKANANFGAGTASAGTAIRTMDVTPPSGAITIRASTFTTFLNSVTFGRFFKDTVNVSITGTDAGSGVNAIAYYLSAAELPGTTDWTAIAWVAGDSTSVTANWKGIVYARIIDNEGNETVINSQGVVVFTDSAQDTANISFTRGGTNDVTANVTLNGNTIAKIMNGGTTLTSGTQYSVSGGTITFKAAYLDTLAAGAYTLTISYNPMGQAFVSSSENDEPATTAIALTITKANPVVTWPTNLTATYGQTLADVSLPGNGSGTPAGTFSWTAGNAVSVGSVGTQTHNLTFTPTDTANYNAVSGDVSVVVNPAAIPSAAITVTAPAVAATPSTTATGSGNFTVGAVTWSPADSPFKGSMPYTAQVTLTANANYTFLGLAVATINGQGATISNNTSSAVTLSYQFPATGAASLTGMQVVSQPAKLNYLVGETLNLAGLSVQLLYNDGTDEIVAFGDFGSRGITASPAHGTAMALSHTGTTVAVSFGSFTQNTDALSVSLAPGAAVNAPTMAGKTGNSVTLNNVAAPANGQAVEYAYSTTNTAPAAGWQDGLTFNGLTEYTEYYFFARAKANTNFGAGTASAGTAIRTADVTPPTGTITIRTNDFTSLLNNITFGYFFKNTVNISIAGDDTGSGAVLIMYYLSSVELPGTTDWTSLPWMIGDSVNVTANWKGVVYARIFDREGNATVINSDGVVVFTDSAQDTANISFTKGGTNDVTANVTLNGNTIAKIMNGAATLTSGTQYSVSGGTITFKAAYLDTLAAGAYILTVSYNPMGEAYETNAGNDEPAATTIALTITKANPVVTWPTNLTATYGQTLADVSLPGNGSGTPAGTFTWTAGNAASVGSVGTQTHNLTFTPTDTVNYSAVSGDVQVVVNPAPSYGISLDIRTHTFENANEGYDDLLALIATITNTGNQPTGDLTLAVSGYNADAFVLSTDTISSIAVGGTGSFTVTPKVGLAAGTYTATVALQGENGISETFDISFTVDPNSDIEPTIVCRKNVILQYRESKQLAATGENLRWSSSNTKLVTVDQTGRVTSVKGFLKFGTAIIRAENSAGFVEFNVKVVPAWWQWFLFVALFGWLLC